MIEESEPRLHGILVTFRRPQWVARTLVSLADQERRLDRLVIVDNVHVSDTNRSRAKTPPRLIDSSAWQRPRIVDTTRRVEAGSDTRSAEWMTRTGSSFWTTTTRLGDRVSCESWRPRSRHGRSRSVDCLHWNRVDKRLAQRLKNPDLSLY
jgi:hypothetical protein